jgi:alpha-beta hydrolase superfamily lysophospholipase
MIIIGYLLLTIVVLYLMALLTVWIVQHYIIFHPVPLGAEYLFVFDAAYQELSLPSYDGQTAISALHFKCDTLQAKKKVILYCHGNADNIQRWGEHHVEFMARGYDFFVWDYRGYGKTKGKASLENIYSDAQQCYNYLTQYYDNQDIVMYGRSLGTGISAMLTAQNNAPLLFLETPYDSILGVFHSKAPFFYLPKILKYDFSTTQYLPQIKCHVCVMHGIKDEIIAYGRAKKLKPFLKKEDIFITFPDGKHKNLNTFALYHETLDTVLNKYEQIK